jgi:hypothetical protein
MLDLGTTNRLLRRAHTQRSADGKPVDRYYTLLITATTRPRTVASSPSMGS